MSKPLLVPRIKLITNQKPQIKTMIGPVGIRGTTALATAPSQPLKHPMAAEAMSMVVIRVVQ